MNDNYRYLRTAVYIALLGLLSTGCGTNSVSQKELAPDALILWYNQPAANTDWTDALPVGNGHIGAMIFGGADTDHIQFNESSLWTDGPRSYAHEGAYKYLDQIRNLLFTGEQQQAEQLAEAHFMGVKNHDPETYRKLRLAWLKKIRRDTTAAAVAYNDADWPVMQLPLLNGWETDGHQGLDGAVWFRVGFDVPEDWKGKDLFIDLGRIRDLDFCYVNGCYIGRDSGISTKRHYLIPASVLHTGRNLLAVQVVNFFDKGGFTGVKNDRPFFVAYPTDKTPQAGVNISRTWKFRIQDDNPPAYPQYEASYQPFGDIFIKDEGRLAGGEVKDYRRSLDIRNALSVVTYKRGGVTYTRNYFASAADPVMVIDLKADKAGAVQFETNFGTVHKEHRFFKIDDQTIGLKVQVKNGALFGVSALKVKAIGPNARVSVTDSALKVRGADSAVLYLVAATNFISYQDVSGNPDSLCKAYLASLEENKKSDYRELLQRHQRAYHRLFDRFDIRIGTQSRSDLPTDQRIRQFSVSTDPGLIDLYTQYARYLMISATPPGGRAANLQGIWNPLLTPPWGSKYTSNINLEMNYWPAEPLNLSACTQPLFELMETLAKTGAVTANRHYGAPGWVLHHNTDIWGASAPIDAAKHGIWVGGSAWLSHHLWDHFAFTRDTVFLRDTGYPIMKKAAEFYVHFLVKDPVTGFLVSSPSNSPEHGGLVAGPTMDHQMIRDLFENCIQAGTILGVDQSFRDSLEDKYNKIAPNKIGRYGQLQEWMQDIDDTSDTHRHVSHLWGVYPGNDINWEKDTAMMRAARQSLIYRGDGGTGWSLAWKVNLWARFRSGNHALKILEELLRPAEGAGGGERGGVYRNLMDAHPPFQIDGNFGGAAGVAEMLIQSQNGYIDLLPALPDSLETGWVRGICARGGYELNIWWKHHRLEKVAIKAIAGGSCNVRYGELHRALSVKPDHWYYLNGQLETFNQ